MMDNNNQNPNKTTTKEIKKTFNPHLKKNLKETDHKVEEHKVANDKLVITIYLK